MRRACRQPSLAHQQWWISQDKRTRSLIPELSWVNMAYCQRFLLTSEGRRGKRQHVPPASIILIESYGAISASCLQVCLDLLMLMTSGWIQRYCRQSAPVVKPRFDSAQDLLQRPETNRRSRPKSIGKRCFWIYEPKITQALQSSKSLCHLKGL